MVAHPVQQKPVAPTLLLVPVLMLMPGQVMVLAPGLVLLLLQPPPPPAPPLPLHRLQLSQALLVWTTTPMRRKLRRPARIWSLMLEVVATVV